MCVCGEKYLTTHRDKAAGKKFANAWELFYNTLMCDTYEDFLMARDSLFDNLTIEDMIRQRFNL